MRLVLDANEYIFAFNQIPPEAPRKLIDLLVATRLHDVRIQRIIVREVSHRLFRARLQEFYRTLEVILEKDCNIDENYVIPHHIAQHYQDVGFKEADAHIAAYAQVVGADMVISENRRDFHALARHLPFQVADAEQFLKRHAAGR